MTGSTSKINLENWMGNLNKKIRNEVPIINLAIPGSHNSMTYGINWMSKIAPDASKTIRNLYMFFPYTTRRWAITQKFTATEQLKNGIRYFDLRLAKSKENNTTIYRYTHGLFAMPISEPLKEINKFLSTHPKELVILDFQHFYDTIKEDYSHIGKIIQDIFKDKIYGPKIGPIFSITLEKLFQRRKQVIVVYRNGPHSFDFYNWKQLLTPWPNLKYYKDIEKFLEAQLKKRNVKTAFVSQYIYTPDSSFIAQRPFSSLQSVANGINDVMVKWINLQIPGPFKVGTPRVNIFIADFVDYQDSNFARAVVKLNNKLRF